jgi:hypothetical protein
LFTLLEEWMIKKQFQRNVKHSIVEQINVF